jgi:hypothetical protein
MSGFYKDAHQGAITGEMFGSRASFPTPPGTYYVALFTTMPGTTGSGGVEASYTGYARFAVANSSGEFGAPAGSPPVVSNTNDWDFGIAGSGPTSVVGFGFYDDPTSTATAHFFAAVTLTGAPVTINNGADVKFLAGAVDLGGC